MVESAVTDIIGSTVTTDDPLAAFNDMVFLSEDSLAGVATAFLHSSHHRLIETVGNLCRVLVLEPLFEHCFEFVGAVSALKAFLHESSKTLTQFAVCDLHTETVLAEVLEEGVGPSRTVTLLVLGIRSRRYRTGVDRGTTRSVSDDLAVADELADKLQIRCLTAAGASAGELEERRSELRVLDIRSDVDEVLLGSHFLYAVIPVGSFAELALEIHHSECFADLRITRTYIDAVTAAEAVHNAYLHTEVHTLHGSRSFHLTGSRSLSPTLSRREGG